MEMNKNVPYFPTYRGSIVLELYYWMFVCLRVRPKKYLGRLEAVES